MGIGRAVTPQPQRGYLVETKRVRHATPPVTHMVLPTPRSRAIQTLASLVAWHVMAVLLTAQRSPPHTVRQSAQVSKGSCPAT